MSRYLLETLSNTYGLRRQLKVLVSAVLLDSSCAAMQEFYSNLFHRMDSKECLDEGDLTQNLQFCLGIAYPDVAPYFNIVFPQRVKSKRSSASSSTEEVLSSLSLDFSDLWPLCIVLKRSDVIKYTKIFQFCLMLRRASFTIERLHFKEIGSHFDFEDEERSFTSSFNSLDGLSDGCESKDNTLPLAHRIHRLQLLRQWVLYFSRVLRDHFSSAVFVPFSSKIEELLDKSNFSDFKQEHELFLTVERIHELWVGPPNGIREAELDLLEEKYSSCHRLVANFLSALASVKFCPLVDGLAQCLTYNCPT
ncbi:Gamma-tubulin complex component 5 [Armadillidium vulgare]|nr:Gamma-tubulin complex component 5 [Armadillidium vulgare]